ncbi:MFS transporter [Microbacterium sp. zg.Y909]|uniref:MFS transporter n=1 Tax=Microbacterium sp. zg.Y909 TaxID=2969413 RepID=UPI00214C5C6A|nr:MFS transporter [Microbacterium sp. zg.Y909]MCR2824066.1 MFS transporter [Microbacterium sp. zg.Y909]
MPTSGVAGSRRRLILALAIAGFSHGLMQSFLNPLLPTLRHEYGASAAATAWLVTAFLLASSIAMPIAGRLGDMFGRARVLRIVMLVFTAGTLVAAVADTYVMMLVARVIQGAAGALFPLAFGLLRERLSERAMVGGIGVVSSTVAVGSGVAVVVAGPLVAGAGLRSVFVIAAVVVALATVLVWVLIPQGTKRANRGSVDVVGAVLLAVWLTGLLVCVTQGASWGWSSPLTIASLLVSMGAFTLWVAVERRADAPIVDMRLLGTPTVVWANLLAFLFGFLLFAGMIAVPAFVQSPRQGGFGFGATIADTAIYLLPQTVLFLVMSLLASTMYRWPGSRVSILLGVAFALAGAGSFAVWHQAPYQVIIASALMGVGIGLIYAHLTSVIVSSVPESEVGSVSGMNTNVRNIGGAFGAQVCGGLIALGGDRGFTMTFMAMAAVAVLALIPALCIVARRRGPGGAAAAATA